MNKWLRGFVAFLAFLGVYALTMWAFWPKPAAVWTLPRTNNASYSVAASQDHRSTWATLSPLHDYPAGDFYCFDSSRNWLSPKRRNMDGCNRRSEDFVVVGDELVFELQFNYHTTIAAMNTATGEWRTLFWGALGAWDAQDKQYAFGGKRVAIHRRGDPESLEFRIVDLQGEPRPRVFKIPGRRNDLRSWAFSDSGKLLAVSVFGPGVVNRLPEGVEIWDVDTQKMLRRISTDELRKLPDGLEPSESLGNFEVGFYDDDRRLIFCPYGTLRALRDGRRQVFFALGSNVRWRTFSNRDKVLSVGVADESEPVLPCLLNDGKDEKFQTTLIAFQDQALLWERCERQAPKQFLLATNAVGRPQGKLWEVPPAVQHSGTDVVHYMPVPGTTGLLLANPDFDRASWANFLGPTLIDRVPDVVFERCFPTQQYWWRDWQSDELYRMRSFTKSDKAKVSGETLPNRIAIVVNRENADHATLEIWSAPPPRIHWLWNGVLAIAVGVATFWRLPRRRAA